MSVEHAELRTRLRKRRIGRESAARSEYDIATMSLTRVYQQGLAEAKRQRDEKIRKAWSLWTGVLDRLDLVNRTQNRTQEDSAA